MRKTRITVKMVLAIAVLAILTAGSIAIAGKKPPPGPGPGSCPKDILCADVWNPVTCANGITYSNQCYADRACAPGPCTPAGGGPI